MNVFRKKLKILYYILHFIASSKIETVISLNVVHFESFQFNYNFMFFATAFYLYDDDNAFEMRTCYPK